MSSVEESERASTFNQEEKYRHDGVSLMQTENGAILRYQSHGHEVCRSLPAGGPKKGIGEVHEKDIGLHFLYDKGLQSWLVAHYYPHHLRGSREDEWFEDTLFISDDGKVEIKKGFFPSKPATMWPHFVELGFGIIGLAVGFWLSIFIGIGGSGGTFWLVMGAILALICGATLVLYYRSLGRTLER